MFVRKKKLRRKEFDEWLYLDGMAVATAITIDRAETNQSYLNVATGMKFAMEHFAERCGHIEQLHELYKKYPKIEELQLKTTIVSRDREE